MKRPALLLTQGAIIAAVYAILTITVAPISSGLIQCRISEAMCVLPYFTPAAVPGLFIGCLLANLLTGAVIYDVIFGSLATLIAALLAWGMAKLLPPRAGRLLAPLPAVLINAAVVGYLLAYVYQVGLPFIACAAYVAAGQAVACYGLGYPLLLVLERFRDRLKLR